MSNRKDDHVKYATEQYNLHQTDFEAVKFVHHSLAHHAISEIDLATTFLGENFSTPFYINAMTGGSEFTKNINAGLATVARETGIAMASGSISAALKDASVADSFKVIREINPNGFVLANLGANHGLESAKRAVDLLEANALQIHLNTPQEIVMPEGERDFRAYHDNLAEIITGIDVPVLVKEVGFGMSFETMRLLYDLGVRTVDVSGHGGTNFALIENDRLTDTDFSFMADWGQSTIISLLEAQPLMKQMDIVASGGIKNPLQMLKALALGAKSVAMSGLFLHSILHGGVDDTVKLVDTWREQLKLMMLMLDVTDLDTLTHTDLIITGQPAEWSTIRQININHFASRSRDY